MSEELQEIQLTHHGKSYRAELHKEYSLARSLSFNSEVDGAFGLPAATAKAVELGDFVGDTQRGGSVNCATLMLHPHGDGTHSESAAHVEHGSPLLDELSLSSLSLAAVLLVEATRFSDTPETYIDCAHDDDWVLTRSSLENAWLPLSKMDVTLSPNALVIGRCDHGENAYFTFEAMQFLQERALRHVLVEEKSIDRLDDDGLLANHRTWFELAPRGKKQVDLSEKKKLVTEMIRSPVSFVERQARAQQGCFALLSLAVPPWRTDAAPTFPALFPLLLDSQSESSLDAS